VISLIKVVGFIAIWSLAITCCMNHVSNFKYPQAGLPKLLWEWEPDDFPIVVAFTEMESQYLEGGYAAVKWINNRLDFPAFIILEDEAIESGNGFILVGYCKDLCPGGIAGRAMKLEGIGYVLINENVESYVERLMAHEFMHVLGIRHRKDAKILDLMNHWVYNTIYHLHYDEVFEVRKQAGLEDND